MKKIVDDDLLFQIYSVVEEIPVGCVATYGQIAKLIGKDKNARLIGKALSISSFYGNFPCHRVVNHVGRTVPGWTKQIELLKNEHVIFKNDTHVDLTKHKWII